jgi:hypothetical protein
MNKRSPFWLIGIAAILLMGCWLYFVKGVSVHPLKAVPPYLNEVSIFPINQMDESLDLPAANRPQAKDFSLLKQATGYWVDTNLSFDSTLYYAYDRNNSGTAASLMLIQLLSDKKAYSQWMGFLPDDQKTEHVYRGTTVIHYEQKGGSTCFFAITKGIFLMSFDQRQVERSIALIDEKAPNLYAHLKRQNLLKKQHHTQLLFNTGTPTQPRWTQLNWHHLEQQDSLWGIDQGVAGDFYKRIQQQPAVDFSTMLTVLPDRIQLADMISTEQVKPYFRQREALGPQFWDASLQDLLGEQLAYVMEEGSRGRSVASFLIASLKDSDQALEALQRMTDQNGMLEQFAYQAHSITRSLAENVSSPFFGDHYPDISNPYWTVIEGFLICSSDPDRLKLWMDYLVLQKNLARSGVVRPFFSIIKEKSQRLVFWQASFTENTFGGEAAWWLRWTATHQEGVISWNTSRDRWQANGKVKSGSWTDTSVEIFWRKDLYQALEYGPSILINPLTEEVEGILVQDSDHRLYLFDPGGAFLWAVELDGPILGGLQTFQINPVEWGALFNTRLRIYKLDGMGRQLADWAMQVPASQGLQKMVFEEPGDPHFFLPSAGQGIYGYNVLGDALVNWNPCRVASDFQSPVFHMASQTKDHLFWLDGDGRLRAKYRDGTDVEIKGLPSGSLSLFFSEKSGWTYVLGKRGSIGRLTPDLQYREMLKGGSTVSAFQWTEKEGALYLIKKDQNRIQRWKLEGDPDSKSQKAERQLNMPYPAGNHRVGLLKAGDTFWTVVQDIAQQRLQILDDQGNALFSEYIPCDGEFSLFQRFDNHFLTTSLDGELMVYQLRI